MKDVLGDRMKKYEGVSRIYLPQRSYIITRIDGKAFHTYTKGFKRPFDDDLMEDMDDTAKYLCKNIMGVKLAFVQSDEISLVLTDFEKIGTEAWFDNNIQKMCSISASMATNKFNQLRLRRKINSVTPFSEDILMKFKMAEFDSRVFQIPQRIEVMNYLLWRQQDTTRNSIQSVAQSLYSPKELNGKNTSQLQEMIFQKGINWNDYDAKYKRGRVIVKQEIVKNNTTRNVWNMVEPPIFTQDKEFLENLIPKNYI